MLVLFVILLTLVSRAVSQTGPGIPCFCMEELSQPEMIRTSTSIHHAFDGSGRIFITEQAGLIHIFQDEVRLPEPFLNVTDKIVIEGISGLLGVTFHPNFTNNGLVYAYYTSNSTTGDFYNNVVEYRVSGSNPNKLDPDTERVVFQIKCGGPDDCHLGGAFLFGADNYLYVSMGDHGCCGDDHNDGQNRTNYMSAIHRIDVDTRTGDLEYGIPPDNPFLSDPTVPPEMYAYGFRNPYAGSMDQGDTNTGYGYGRIFISDVGDSMWEEVNILESGGNYGWSAYEGPDCFKPSQCENIGPHIAPAAAYNHSTYGICVIGGDMYRGSLIPDLNGWFLFSDYLSKFFGMYETAVDQWQWEVIPVCVTCPAGQTNQFPPLITCLGASDEGEQYFASTDLDGAFDQTTRVFKLVDPNTS